MCNALQKSKIAIFDYTFSLKGSVRDIVGTGLPVSFLNLEKCKKLLEKKGKVLILKPYTIKTYHADPNKITYDCVYGDEDVVSKYFAELKKKTRETVETYGDPKFIKQR